MEPLFDDGIMIWECDAVVGRRGLAGVDASPSPAGNRRSQRSQERQGQNTKI